MGSRGIAPPFMILALDVSAQLHAPVALSPGKEPPVPTEQEAGWATELVPRLWRGEQSLTLAGNRTSAIQRVGRRYTDRAIPAPIHMLLFILMSHTCQLHFLLFLNTWFVTAADILRINFAQ
jgi:hypothetical protein